MKLASVRATWGCRGESGGRSRGRTRGSREAGRQTLNRWRPQHSAPRRVAARSLYVHVLVDTRARACRTCYVTGRTPITTGRMCHSTHWSFSIITTNLPSMGALALFEGDFETLLKRCFYREKRQLPVLSPYYYPVPIGPARLQYNQYYVNRNVFALLSAFC